MPVFRRTLLFAILLAAALILGRPDSRAVLGAGTPAEAGSAITAAEQFYTRVLGDWVGTAVSRLNGAAPATAYFHLVISRVDGHTFREEYTFYRIRPKAQVLECSGTQSVLTTIGSHAGIRQTCRGTGTILIDSKPKNETFEASGEAHSTGPDGVEAEARGKIAVDGMPFNLGKNGKVRKATAAWSLEADKLIGQTRVETSFRAWLFAKKFWFETQLRAERGADVESVAGRATSS